MDDDDCSTTQGKGAIYMYARGFSGLARFKEADKQRNPAQRGPDKMPAALGSEVRA